MGLHFSVITLFPEMIESIFSVGVVGQAKEKQLLKIETVNPRTFTTDLHKTVDDRPFGGGDGMVMLAEPLEKSILSIKKHNSYVVYLSPQGKKFSDQMANEWSKKEHIVLICGRYGGIDQRLINSLVDEEVSIGDYVLSGGELAAAVVIDSAARKIPGVLGHESSASQDSFVDGFLECPSFTRPREYLNQEVPAVLLSGNHKLIAEWKARVSELVTLKKRPDLVNQKNFSLLHLKKLQTFWQSLSEKEKAILGLEEIHEFEDIN